MCWIYSLSLSHMSMREKVNKPSAGDTLSQVPYHIVVTLSPNQRMPKEQKTHERSFLMDYLAGAEPHSGLGGPWPLQNFFFSHQTMKKKKKGPPNIPQPAPPPISHQFSQPSIKNQKHHQIKKKKKFICSTFKQKKKKTQKKFELKSEKKKKITKPSPVAHGKRSPRRAHYRQLAHGKPTDSQPK